MKNKFHYAALELDEVSQDILRDFFGPILKDCDKIYCHHMTIAFGKGLLDDHELLQYLMDHYDEEFNMTVVALGESDRAIAVEVDTKMCSKNKHKHITLGTKNGGKPYESNLIQDWEDTMLIPLKGRVRFF